VAEKPRGSETVGDAVRSLVALLGIIAAVVVAFTAMRPDQQPPAPVDYSGILDRLRAEYPYPVLAPTPVPSGWTATSTEHSARTSGNRWRLGFVTDDDGFVGLEQSDGEVESFLDDQLHGFSKDGTAEIDGATWQQWIEAGDQPDRALVLVDDGVATVVLGTEPYDVLRDFAASLES
jgi:hypothetical protein